MNIVQEAKFIMANVENNNNKFWYIFRYDTHLVRTENGRVGNTGDSHEFPHDDESDAQKFFDKKCREKEKKGYKKLNVVTSGSPRESTSSVAVKMDLSLTQVAKDQIEHNSPEVAKLIDRLSKANTHNILSSTTMTYNANTGLFSTPCGILDRDTLDKARDLLVILSKYVEKRDYRNPDYIKNLEEYLMLIPQKVGRKLNPEELYTSTGDIRKQNDILDSLGASIQSVITDSAPDKSDKTDKAQAPKVFSVKLFKSDDDKVFDRLRRKFQKTLLRGHSCGHLDVKTVYTVEIESMKNAFDKKGSPIGNIMELWHGTRIFNVLSILKGGLQIPKSSASNVTGRMFGDGAYFSDISSKSLNYAYGYWDGGTKDQNPFMFLADTAMGKYYVPKSSHESLPKRGFDSTFAKPGESGIQNNEMIVYDIAQCNLTYLLEFSPGGK